MKFSTITTLLLILSVHFSQAEEKALIYKNWKTWRSDYGFEFKYPDCWIVKGDDLSQLPPQIHLINSHLLAAFAEPI